MKEWRRHHRAVAGRIAEPRWGAHVRDRGGRRVSALQGGGSGPVAVDGRRGREGERRGERCKDSVCVVLLVVLRLVLEALLLLLLLL